jgi:hypothetical protein
MEPTGGEGIGGVEPDPEELHKLIEGEHLLGGHGYMEPGPPDGRPGCGKCHGL